MCVQCAEQPSDVSGAHVAAVLAVRRSQAFSSGARVLNLFGYTGGFSIYAGLAGAAAVTTVDVADAALAAAEANWALNGLKASRHEAVTLDAFEFLERAHAGESPAMRRVGREVAKVPAAVGCSACRQQL